jgi:cellulose synthase (UDP-forming)
MWAAVSLVVMILITLPISLQTHVIAGAAVVAAMMILKTFRPHGTWRLIVLALGTSVVLRYVYWRTATTLPPINEPQNFLPGPLVYLAEMYNAGMLGLSLFVVPMPLLAVGPASQGR